MILDIPEVQQQQWSGTFSSCSVECGKLDPPALPTLELYAEKGHIARPAERPPFIHRGDCGGHRVPLFSGILPGAAKRIRDADSKQIAVLCRGGFETRPHRVLSGESLKWILAVAKKLKNDLTGSTFLGIVLFVPQCKTASDSGEGPTLIRTATTILLALAVFFVVASAACAHFAMIIPSQDVIGKQDNKEISLLLQFTHPFEGGPLMQMDRPEKFGVVANDAVTDLLGTLKEKKVDGKSTWETTFKVTKPADYVFFLAPSPYWEPAEDKFIVHYTKVIVDALGAEEGWDKPIGSQAGIPVEIVPLSRPYSLYGGNLFTGRVVRDGKPAADVDVEVEFWGQGKTKAATDAHVAQVVKTDENGVFSFTMPKPGWWGFSALMEGPTPMKHQGEDKKVETGAVIWVHAYPMQ